jgi:hypothetical protein
MVPLDGAGEIWMLSVVSAAVESLSDANAGVVTMRTLSNATHGVLVISPPV